MQDVLDHLRIDAGQPTIARLIQEREAAATEIDRLRRVIEQLTAIKHTAQRAPRDHAPRKNVTVPATPNMAMLLRLADVCKTIGAGRSTIYKWMADGEFPRPLKISQRSVRWRMQDIEAWRQELEQVGTASPH